MLGFVFHMYLRSDKGRPNNDIDTTDNLVGRLYTYLDNWLRDNSYIRLKE